MNNVWRVIFFSDPETVQDIFEFPSDRDSTAGAALRRVLGWKAAPKFFHSVKVEAGVPFGS